MKVSLLIPVYNVEKYVERSIRSAFEQDYNNIEYIIVNDCSSDSSMDVISGVISEYPERNGSIKILNHSRNRGLAASRMTGISASSGDALFFFDSDDYLERNAISVLVDAMNEAKCDIVSAGFVHEFGGNKQLIEIPPDVDSTEYLRLILERKVYCNIWARLYRRTIISFDNSFIEGINNGEDYMFVSRVFSCTKHIKNISTPILHYLHTNTQSYSAEYKRSNLEQVLKAEFVINDYYKKIGNEDYLKFHAIGNLKLKSEQIIILLRSNSANKDDYKYIITLFISCNKFIAYLPFQDRMILYLIRYLSFTCMKLYVRLGFNVKQILKFK